MSSSLSATIAFGFKIDKDKLTEDELMEFSIDKYLGLLVHGNCKNGDYYVVEKDSEIVRHDLDENCLFDEHEIQHSTCYIDELKAFAKSRNIEKYKLGWILVCTNNK